MSKEQKLGIGDYKECKEFKLFCMLREDRNNELDFRLGKILTIIDALFPQGSQNKCAKDLVRSAFIEEFYSVTGEIINQFVDKYCQKENCSPDEYEMFQEQKEYMSTGKWKQSSLGQVKPEYFK